MVITMPLWLLGGLSDGLSLSVTSLITTILLEASDPKGTEVPLVLDKGLIHDLSPSATSLINTILLEANDPKGIEDVLKKGTK